MKNSKLRAVLTNMLAVKEMRLDGHGDKQLTEGGLCYLRAESAALREALTRLELFDEARLANVKEKIAIDWREPRPAVST